MLKRDKKYLFQNSNQQQRKVENLVSEQILHLHCVNSEKRNNMPYTIRKPRKKGGKYKIIRKDDGKVVGTSTSLAKARASIGYRMRGEK